MQFNLSLLRVGLYGVLVRFSLLIKACANDTAKLDLLCLHSLLPHRGSIELNKYPGFLWLVSMNPIFAESVKTIPLHRTRRS